MLFSICPFVVVPGRKGGQTRVDRQLLLRWAVGHNHNNASHSLLHTNLESMKTSLAHRVLSRLRLTCEHQCKALRILAAQFLQLGLIILGASIVAGVAVTFASMVDVAHAWQLRWITAAPWAVWLVLPFGLAGLRWLTLRYAPLAEGSGIPQVMASMSMEHDPRRFRLISLVQSVWKIPLTFFALLFGASVGREGPSVQVGAAIMVSWGRLCDRLGVPLKNFRPTELMATGAAGGLAAAFNAPLAGVLFAVEELGRDTALRWQGRLLIGVIATGLIVVALSGDNPYFGTFTGSALSDTMMVWTLLCGAICGVAGGAFALLLCKGPAGVVPARCRSWVKRHPVRVAFILGLCVAAFGTITAHATYGTGYGITATALAGQPIEGTAFGLNKLLATVASYWAGIPGGIFTPALTAGAGIGEELARWTNHTVDQKVLVLLCMSAFLAAATQAPLTASIITMEMTSSESMLVWLLVVSLVASLVSRLVCPQPFYHFSAHRFEERIRASGDEDTRSREPRADDERTKPKIAN